MREVRVKRWASAALGSLLTLAGCAYPYTPPALPLATAPAPVAAPAERRAPVTILISIDGFRPDYLDRGYTPTLSALADGGVRGAMSVAFPTKTFPSHWTLVTGLTPERHGIVANRMEDPARPGQTFTMATVDPYWWNAAEPIWVTAERAGIRTASVYWPGSAVAWGGTRHPRFSNEVIGGNRPSDWLAFAEGAPAAMRVNTALDWLRRPRGERPSLTLLYFDAVDTAAHHYGIDSAETNRALADTDAAMRLLVDGLAAMGQPANIVVTSDHGMAATSPDRAVLLDALVPAGSARLLEQGPIASIYPAAGREQEVAGALLRNHSHMRCYRKGQLPQRLRLGAHPRVAPILCLADEGWVVVSDAAAAARVNLGEHGYDPALPSMRALFVANGPAFRRGVRLRTFSNTDVAPLLRRLLGLPAGAGLDGTVAPFDRAMR